MPPRNFSWFVKDRLAALGFPSTRTDIEFLCSIGVKRLISLTERRPSLHGFPLTHVHIPIVDFTPPSIEQVNEFLSTVEKANSEEEVSVWLFNRSSVALWAFYVICCHMTDDKFYTSLSANNIMAKLTNHVQRTRLITPSTDKHYSFDSEDDFR